MTKPQLPKEFVKLCKKVTAKRPRTVVAHILKHGFITTQELKDKYGYNHPPRAVRDVKENGIPIEMFRVEGSDGRRIAAYRFGDPSKARFGKLIGRTAFTKALKQTLIGMSGCRCAIYLNRLTNGICRQITAYRLKSVAMQRRANPRPKTSCFFAAPQIALSHGRANTARIGLNRRMQAFADPAIGHIPKTTPTLRCDQPADWTSCGWVQKSKSMTD